MLETTQPTPTQPELVEGAELIGYNSGRLLASATFKVTRLTKTQAVLDCGQWQERVRRQPFIPRPDSQPSWHPVESGSRWSFVLLTPALQEVVSLSNLRQEVDSTMKLVSQHSHKLPRARLQALQAYLVGLLESEELPTTTAPDF